MKQLISVIISTVLAAFVFAQGQVTINGVITNPKGKEVAVSKNGLFDTENVCKAAVDKKGVFLASFEIEDEGFYILKHGNEITQMYLAPGNKMRFSIDTEQFDETVTYSGNGAAVNNYLAKKYLLEEELTLPSKELYSLAPDEFIVKTAELRTALEQRLEKFIASEENLPDGFQKLAIADIKYSMAEQIVRYPSYHEYFTKNKMENKEAFLLKNLTGLNPNDKALLCLNSYRNYLLSYIRNIASAKINADSTLKENSNYWFHVQYEAIKENINIGEVSNYLYTSFIHNKIRFGNIDAMDELLAEYEKRCNNTGYVTKIKEEYRKWEHLAPGKPAPDFAYADINGKKVSLSDFRGKYVYIDVWATWCGPCRAEIPLLKELEEACKEYNIQFIGISVDNDKKPWKKMVKEEGMHGTQLYADGGWKSEIMENYHISGIPRFILIDREGKIIDVNAPRPSGKIKEVIEQLEDIIASK